MAVDLNTLENNKLNADELIELKNKIDLLLEQHLSTQKAIAHLRGDLPTIVKEVVTTILKKRAAGAFL